MSTAPAGPALAAAVLSRVDAVADRLVRTILERNPGYRAVNVVTHDDLWRSCHDNVVGILQVIATGVDLDEDDPRYEAAHTTGRRRAEQGMPLDDVLRSFRLGGRLIWDALTSEARAVGVVDPDELLDLGSVVWELVDRTSSVVAAAYHEEERRLVRADEQRKVALWEGLLSGRAKDAAFGREAVRTLGLPEEGPYVAAAADLGADFTDLARELGSRLTAQGIASAWHVRGDLVAGLLALPHGADARTAVDAGRSVDASLRLGLSLRMPAVGEVDEGFRQATLALRTLTGPGVVALQDRMPEALLVDAPRLSAHLVELWLGPLLRLSPGERGVLLSTLEHWVSAHGSPARAAELAHCHRNTVLNRLRRVEALTGRTLTAGQVPLELALALRAHRVL